MKNKTPTQKLSASDIAAVNSLTPEQVIDHIENKGCFTICKTIVGMWPKYQLWDLEGDMLLVVSVDSGNIAVTPYLEGERNPHQFDISHRTFSKRDSKKIYKLLKKRLLL